MKILLVGEFSGVHNNLKKGLTELGHEVKLAADGDGFKNFGFDLRIAPFNGRYIGKLLNVIYLLFNIKRFIGYDIVQFISPFSLSCSTFYFGLVHLVFYFNKVKVLYACGTDPYYFKLKKQFKYFPFEGELPYSSLHIKYHSWFVKKVDKIITPNYPYFKAYESIVNKNDVISFPGNNGRGVLENFKKTGDVINIKFGITRYEMKGTEYILKALNQLEEKYKSRISVRVFERLPFAEYVKILEGTDILIDQCKSYSYGMNAIFAMEKGIIVLSGSEKEGLDFMSLDHCPVFNIRPNVKQIYRVLEELVNKNKSDLDEIKIDTVRYVNMMHNNTVVSKKFEEKYRALINV